MYQTCKGKVQDLVPDDPEDRRLLRELCRRTLGFEYCFFATYRDYLLGLLRSAEPDDRSFAAEQLHLIVYPDEEVAAALRNLGG